MAVDIHAVIQRSLKGQHKADIDLVRTVVRVLTMSAGSSMVSKVLRRTDPLRLDPWSMSPTDGGSMLPDCSVFSGSTPS